MAAVDHSVGVGGDVLVRCNKCELDLWHTVIAKVDNLIRRVKCNTCKTEHAVRGETRAHKQPRAAKPPATVVVRMKDRVPHKPWKELMAGRDEAAAVDYSVKAVIAKNDLVRHPLFGLGIVLDLADDRKKATIQFESGEKVLAVGR